MYFLQTALLQHYEENLEKCLHINKVYRAGSSVMLGVLWYAYDIQLSNFVGQHA